MKKFSIIFLILALMPLIGMAKGEELTSTKYNRSSIYSILVNHTEQKFGKEIKSQFLEIPTPDQYNNHDLSVKVINVSQKADYKDSIDAFINNNYIASRMVAKWFDRNILTGECSMETVKERGIYNASELDKELASRSARGMAMLADAGEELIGNSFLLVNEIRYIDKSKASSAIGAGLKIFGAIAGAVVGVNLSDLTDNLGDMVASLKGFKVSITTHLYQLNWDDETAGIFYKQCYSATPDEAKRMAFENSRNKFTFKYLGKVESAGSNTSFMGINEDQPLMMVRKACQRAIDHNVADLQKNHDQFRIKAPVVSAGEEGITVQIGLKEGLTPQSKFEVLEPEEKNGRMTYKRIAVIQPVEKKIWDNRFMAAEEMAYGANFGATTFKKISGSDVYPGLLVRQID